MWYKTKQPKTITKTIRFSLNDLAIIKDHAVKVKKDFGTVVREACLESIKNKGEKK
jgi:hypothetical protein